MPQRCSAKNRRGEPCRAWAISGNSKCGLHLHPERAAKMGAKHGRKAQTSSLAVVASELSQPVDLPKRADQVRDFLAETLIQVRYKRLDARTASTLVYVASSLLSAIKLADLETRLAALEELSEWVLEWRSCHAPSP